MRPKTYPMEPLARVRRDTVDASVQGLATAILTREEAERRRLGVEAERDRVAAEARAVAGVEQDALGRSELSVVDLQRQGAWTARMQWEAEERARAITAAHEAEAVARAGETQARGMVAHAEAEAKVVEHHREGWLAERARAQEAREEEGAAEAWRPRR